MLPHKRAAVLGIDIINGICSDEAKLKAFALDDVNRQLFDASIGSLPKTNEYATTRENVEYDVAKLEQCLKRVMREAVADIQDMTTMFKEFGERMEMFVELASGNDQKGQGEAKTFLTSLTNTDVKENEGMFLLLATMACHTSFSSPRRDGRMAVICTLALNLLGQVQTPLPWHAEWILRLLGTINQWVTAWGSANGWPTDRLSKSWSKAWQSVDLPLRRLTVYAAVMLMTSASRHHNNALSTLSEPLIKKQRQTLAIVAFTDSTRDYVAANLGRILESKGSPELLAPQTAKEDEEKTKFAAIQKAQGGPPPPQAPAKQAPTNPPAKKVPTPKPPTPKPPTPKPGKAPTPPPGSPAKMLNGAPVSKTAARKNAKDAKDKADAAAAAAKSAKVAADNSKAVADQAAAAAKTAKAAADSLVNGAAKVAAAKVATDALIDAADKAAAAKAAADNYALLAIDQATTAFDYAAAAAVAFDNGAGDVNTAADAKTAYQAAYQAAADAKTAADAADAAQAVADNLVIADALVNPNGAPGPGGQPPPVDPGLAAVISAAKKFGKHVTIAADVESPF